MSDVYGFRSLEEFNRVTRAALSAGKSLRASAGYTGPANNLPTNTDGVYIRITGPMVERTSDRRCVYPAEILYRNLQGKDDDPTNDWLSMSDIGREADNKCVAISPNGEVLKKNMTYGGRSYGVWSVIDPDAETEGDEHEVAAVLVDVPDASAVLRVASSAPDPTNGLYEAYVQQASGFGSPGLEDWELIWVVNYGPSPFAAGHHTGQFVTRLEDDRAVYAVAARFSQSCVKFTPNKRDCVAVTGAVNTTAVWSATAGGWRLGATVNTGDGPATATLIENAFNQLMVKLESANATWYLNRNGCSGEGEKFSGYHTPLELQPTEEEAAGDGSGSGSGGYVSCADLSIDLVLKCVPCSLRCGDFGPFPSTMCVVTASTGSNPDPTPDPTLNCNFFYDTFFNPVTVSFGASGTWGVVGVDYPTQMGGVGNYIGNYTGQTSFPQHDVALRWFGKGTLTNAQGTFTYGVEIWFSDGGCEPRITYYLPFFVFGMAAGLVQLQISLIELTMPFGTPTTFPELPPLGNFPIVVPPSSLGGYQVTDNSGANQSGCPYGVPLPTDYPTVLRWTTVGGGALTPIEPTVYAGGCGDNPTGEVLGCCNGPGQIFEDPGALSPDTLLEIPDGIDAGTHSSGNGAGGYWTFDLSDGTAWIRCTGSGQWQVTTAFRGTVFVDVSSCSPFGLVIPGAVFGSVGDVTLSLA